MRLSALSSLCSLLEITLPEREPQEKLWDASKALLDILSLSENENEWLSFFIKWELGLLRELGFALMLQCCGVTGSTNELAYVSPRVQQESMQIDYWFCRCVSEDIPKPKRNLQLE